MPRVLYVQYTNPAAYPPLEHGSRLIAGAGWDVLFLGAAALGAEKLRFRRHQRIAVRMLGTAGPGWRRRAHYLAFMLWVFGTALRHRPDWIYASDVLSCPAALLSTGVLRIPCIYHEHDSPASAPRVHAPARAAAADWSSRFLMWIRRVLAQRAELCILPNAERAARFRRETGRQGDILEVWNCPSRSELEGDAARAGTDGDFWVLYHGSIVPSRLPLSVVDALARLPDRVKLRIVGYETVGHQGYQEEVMSAARRLGVAGRLEWVGPVPTRTELLQHCRQSDVGLSLMPLETADGNERAMTGASNKPFDYLACGLPVLVSDLPDWSAMFVEPGYGLACDPSDPGSVAEKLAWFEGHRDRARAMGRAGRHRVEREWNYESQFALVLARMTGAPVASMVPGRLTA